jgi:hypothetical protein
MLRNPVVLLALFFLSLLMHPETPRQRTPLSVLSSRSHAATGPETIKRIADTTADVDAHYLTYAKARPIE